MTRTLSRSIGKKRAHWTHYLYLLPAVLFVSVFFISSMFYTAHMSLYEWDGFSPPIFIGLNNYVQLFQDSNFLLSLGNTLIWVVCSLVISVVFPLLLAVLIMKTNQVTLYKNIFYFPNVLSATIAGIITRTMLTTYGLPQIFGLLGLNAWVCDWLAIPYVNTFIMIGSSIWRGIGLNLLLFIIGLNNIDASPVEAATIEGANSRQMYTKVVFPLLKPTFIVVMLMALVNSFKIFDSIWVMTKGGPYRSSETLALTMYQETFIRNHIGLGSAVAIVLTVIILVLSYFNIRNTFKTDSGL